MTSVATGAAISRCMRKHILRSVWQRTLWPYVRPFVSLKLSWLGGR